MSIRLLILSMALCFAPAMAQISLTELMNNTAKVKTITYGTNLLTVPYTGYGQLTDIVSGAYNHFKETGADYYAIAYKITLAKGDRIRIKSSIYRGNSHLDIYRKNGNAYNFIEHNDNISADNLDSYIGLIADKAGDYYIVIADDSPNTQPFYTLNVWIPTTPLYTEIAYMPLTVGAPPVLGAPLNYIEVRGEDMPGAGYSFTAKKGKTYAISTRYPLALLNKLTGEWYEDKMNESSLYAANEDGIVNVFLENRNPDKRDEYYTIEIKEMKTEPVSIAELLGNTTKTIPYSTALAFASGGETNDLVVINGSNYYAAAYKITLAQENNIKIFSSKIGEFHSRPTDSYLYVYKSRDGGYDLIAENDDGGGDLNSYISLTASENSDYYIVVTDINPNIGGSYCLKAWNTGGRPAGVITSIYANAESIDVKHNADDDEILANLVRLTLNGIVSTATVAIANNPYGWAISDDKRSAAYRPVTVSGPYGFEYANGLEPITVNISLLSVPVIAKTPQPASFKAWAQNGTLHLNGLTIGKTWRVYTAAGVLVRQGIATGASATVHLNAKGAYFAHSEKQTLKVVNR